MVAVIEAFTWTPLVGFDDGHDRRVMHVYCL